MKILLDKTRTGLVVLLLCLLPLLAKAEEVTVAAAANVQFTLDELREAFTRKTGIEVKTIIGSSGKLTAQIENGAPFDIFMSADTSFPERLFKGGLTLEAPRVYAYGYLVLWTFKDIDLSKGLAGLADSAIGKIAIASPQMAPYGLQAVNAVRHENLYEQIESKLVYGESISQVNQFVTTQAADVGLTAQSVVMSANMIDKGRWVAVDPQAYEPIAQAMVLLESAGKNEAAARKFYDFMSSPDAREIFVKYGYTLP